MRGLSIRALHRRTGLHRDTIRNTLNSDAPPRYQRPPSGLKLDPFKDEIHRLRRDDSRLPGQPRPRAARAVGLSDGLEYRVFSPRRENDCDMVADVWEG